jgi:23S rRNA (adenine-N6)-dimethyltransferase
VAGRYRRPHRQQPSSGRQSQSARQGQAVQHGRTRQGQWFAGQPPPNPRGGHYLTDRRVIGEFVRASGVGQGDLVFDLGAGFGALTGPLAATGARVIAIEIDQALAGRLRRRFAAETDCLVSVVEADLRCVPLPRGPFYVVANPPFALTTVILRRLLGDPAVKLAGADLMLEWGAAKGLTQIRVDPRRVDPRRVDPRQADPRQADPRQSGPPPTQPRHRELARWAARYEFTLVRRIPAASFSPAPATDAAHLRIRPRTAPGGHRP